MKYRKLRIAWSVAWGVVAVLLVVLWARSYSIIDSFSRVAEKELLAIIESDSGTLSFSHVDEKRFPHRFALKAHGWEYDERDVDANIEIAAPRFDWDLSDGDLTIQVPHWFVLLVALTFAAIPWFRWRFSLRTLLIATTLVAVVLGIIVWMLRVG